MAEKFLSKKGLDRFFEKIKSKFAPLDSPEFKGTPTVETPEFERMTESKVVVNKEYVSKMYDFIVQYIESEKSSFHIRLNIQPKEWEESEGVVKCYRLKEKMQNAELDKASIFVRIDTSRLAPEKLVDVNRNYPVGITNDGVIYTAKVPEYELPVIIDLFASMDMTMWLGGN
ncbi:TPA: hypothetical protein TUU08_000192 [Streptococcus equi subsp. zooepidemicus]|nr:hypothetical protein Javan191_0048 [Streptococcus phage Javan191]HEK9982087.1 hypothetical protein [Streptococcus equi subsp. zooepidemicus]HEL0196442.1 hypothetical protein [Streptococcus equi subsp. zooepidemicus]HEL0205862.1 hypothetical protein [Streptococcus equi subsp. zooepidemicus]HEL0531630.1 hypothetical protein [Streptococcus equi subsp. zooepidemicus]